MFSYVFATASSFFYLPVDNEESDQEIDLYERKYLTWSAGLSDDTRNRNEKNLVFTGNSELGESHVIKAILASSDLYSILGISKSASLDKTSLRQAYLSRSKACHPDKFPNNPDATHAFQKVAVAYDILSQPQLKKLYDNRSPASEFDVFAAHPLGHAEETLRGVILGVFNDFLEGDLEIIKTILKTINDFNPSLKLDEDGINSVLMTLQSVRERALTCKACFFAVHAETTRLLEVQAAFRQLSYFDLAGRSRLAIQLTRIMLGLPFALERALQQKRYDDIDVSENGNQHHGIFPRRLRLLIMGIDVALEKMEKILG